MFSSLQEYFSILSKTRLTHFLTDNESVVYFIYLVGLFVIFPVSLLFGMAIAIVVSIIISVPVLALTLYGVSWGKAHVQLFNPVMLGAVASCFIAFASSIFFAKIAKLYFDSKTIPHLYAITVYLVLFISGPAVYFLYKFYDDARDALEFIIASFEVCYDSRLPVYVTELEFINSKSGKKTNFHDFTCQYELSSYSTHAKFEKFSLRDKFLKRLDKIDFNSFGSSVKNTFPKEILIPRGTDKFTISWYSFVENKYYSDEFPFPLDKMKREKRFDLSSNEYINHVKPLTFEIFSMGNASLSQLSSSSLFEMTGRRVIYNFIKIKEKDLSQEGKASIFNEYVKKNNLDKYQAQLKNDFHDKVLKRYSQQLSEQLTFYDWSVSFVAEEQTELRGNIKIINAYDEHFDSAPDSNIRSSLPRVISFVCADKKYAIYFDMVKLLKVIKDNVKPSASSVGKPVIGFAIHFYPDEYRNSIIKLILNEKTLDFPDLQIYIEYEWE